MSTRRSPQSLSVLGAGALGAALLLAGCSGGSGGDDTAAPAQPTAAPPVSSAPAASPEPTTTAPAGCTGTGDPAPSGAATVSTIDLDGDGSPDTLWIASDGSTRTLGVTTATGATFTSPIDLAGPAGASAFALHPDPAGPAMVLLSDNRVADLLLVQDCALVPATDAAGAPWQFDQGFAGQGTGVGCLDLDGDGTQDLVGLNLVDDTVTRTVIEVDGTVASAGAKDSVAVAGDATAQDTARQITCGDRTLQADGVHEPA